MPRVSVVMAIYNRSDLVGEAVQSILSQTFTDFEFVIVDDGSTDGSADVVAAIKDPRIKLLRQPANRGIATSVNVGIEASSGEYIARMDSDDLCHPDRLEVQVQMLDNMSVAGACCTYARGFGVPNAGEWTPYTNSGELAADLLFRNRIAQPTVMMRRSVLDENHLRYNESAASEDYDLWWKLTRVTSFVCIPGYYASIRRHENRNVVKDIATVSSDADRIRTEQLVAFGIEGDPDFHNRIAWRRDIRRGELQHIHAWLEEVEIHNDQVGFYDPGCLRRVLCDQWLDVCISCVDRIPHVLRVFRASPYGTFTDRWSKKTLVKLARLLNRNFRGSCG
jgi:glycosyltransferase involved in cell wall biosynthesis